MSRLEDFFSPNSVPYITDRKKGVSYIISVDVEMLTIDEEITGIILDEYNESELNNISERTDRLEVKYSVEYPTEDIKNITEEIKEEMKIKTINFIDSKINNIQNLKKDKLLQNTLRKQKLNKISNYEK
jgi:hypothetical protein